VLGSRLVLVGAGDFGREVLWTCMELNAARHLWDGICFIDDRLDAARAALQRYRVDIPVISSIEDFSPSNHDLLLCTIGDPRTKLSICEKLVERNGKFCAVIHPSASIASRSVLGRGVFIACYASISVDVSIGDFVIINSFSGVGHDGVLENGCTLSAHCDVTGHAHLERGVFLGSHAAVMPGVRVGEFAKVAAGSVAFRNVKAGETVIGVPAKALF
jgi:sugar O-acyltransferase (sialic acid O-acetyltransferase NeuD family)